MIKLKIDAGSWVIVCDGRKALILENIGDHVFPNLHIKEMREQANPSTHEQGSSRPGKVHQSVGSARSAVEQTDWHDAAERTFLEGLARHLQALATAGVIKDLIFVAPPRALGMLRHAYSPAIRRVLRAEIDKDLVKIPVHEIEKHLAHTQCKELSV